MKPRETGRWVVLAAGLTLFLGLGSAALFDEDEPKNAACAREMLARGDWLVPTFNEELRTDKPILLYWLTMPAYLVFGVNPFAARLASAILALATVLLTSWLGRTLLGRAEGFWAGIVLSGSLMFIVLGRAATPDATLIFCITLALCAFVAGQTQLHHGRFPGVLDDSDVVENADTRDREAAPDWSQPLPLRATLGMYAAMGLGVLAKGPVGVLMPLLICGIYLFSRLPASHTLTKTSPKNSYLLFLSQKLRELADLRRWWAAGRALRPVAGLGMAAAVALPWYVAVGFATDGAWLAGFLGRHNVDRYLTPMENHQGPPFYYGLAIMIGFFPWSIFLPAALIRAARLLWSGSAADASHSDVALAQPALAQPGTAWRTRGHARHGLAFALCWLGVYFVFFTLAATKLPNYVAPAYPALALLVGAALTAWLATPETARGPGFSRLMLLLAVLGLLITIGLGITSAVLLQAAWWLGVVGLVLTAGALLARHFALRGQPQAALHSLAVACTLFIAGLLGPTAGFLSHFQDGPIFADVLRESGAERGQVGSFAYFPPSLVFYTQGPVARLNSVEQMKAFLDRPASTFVITTERDLALIQAELPPDVVVVARHRRFLRRYDAVLLGRGTTPVIARHNDADAPR